MAKLTSAACLLSVSLPLLCTSSAALAAEAPKVTAGKLAAAGEKLLARRKYEEACAKFAESRAAFETPRALIGLARCNAGLGKTATAWTRYGEAADVAKKRRDRANEELAHRGRTALQRALSRLEVQLADGADVRDLEVRQGGEILPRERFGVAMPVDPGTYELTASAPGRTTWTTRAVVRPGFAKTTIVIPELSPSEPAPAPVVTAPPPVADKPAPSEPKPEGPPPGPPTVLASLETMFVTYNDPRTGPGGVVRFMPTAVWLVSPRAFLLVRAAMLEHLPSRAPSTFALGSIAVGGGYTFDLAQDVTLAPSLLVLPPIGTGGGDKPDPNGFAAMLQGRTIEGTWFAPDYVTFGAGGALAWKPQPFRLQFREFLRYSIRARGASQDATVLMSDTRLQAGWEFPSGIEPYAEIEYTRFLTKIWAACCSPAPDPSYLDFLYGKLGVNGRYGRMFGQLEYIRPLDPPNSRSNYNIFKIGIGVAL